MNRYIVKNAIHNWFGKHGLFARDFGHRRLFVDRKGRAARLSFEWHNTHNPRPSWPPDWSKGRAVRYIMFGISDPYHHRWWATRVTFYPSLGRRPQPISDLLLGRIPSTGYKSWG